ncbi:TetR/AcrR family transcriptional regulator [Yinghuangia soli]|uniref:WHG domain-containing protein n=1 Tax=Yinghuangia soli TaxID=2908204 RepID=A0AA41U2S1_9ACTN|nr:TetR/AcrR family transcriptional regulator [Yinghuangia soli]MCF2532063.1 WHG domain-containing protein [Yinghuangia soli]
MPRAGLSAEVVTAAAAELADEVGFENVTVSALARRFGVKDASLYSHVKNLRDLRERVALRSSHELGEQVTAAVAGRAGRDALLAFGHAYRDYARAHPGRYVALQMRLDPETAAQAPGVQRGMDTTLAVLRAYGLGEPDVVDAARFMRSTFHGFVSVEAADGFGHPRDTGESWERILEGLHVLLENWPAAG